MKVLVAIDSFKGSISSIDGNKAISEGIRDVYLDAEINTFSLADGGEGTVEALVQGIGGQLIKKEVIGPLKEKIDAVYGILGDNKTAVIEVSAACGLPLVPLEQRNPLVTTTYGVGELINDAILQGCREFVIGLGGSSTNDAGVGMLQALGFSFLNEFNNEVELGGQGLQTIKKINRTNALPELESCIFKVACDVNNPLYGPNGAANIFGRQKGADTVMLKQLDEGLENFAQIVQQDIGKDIQHIPGAGAAGGLGAAFVGFLNANLQSGIKLILEITEMEKHIQGMDFVITGEGKMDGQTFMGKAPLGLAQLAKKHGVPVIALAGGINEDTALLNQHGITSYFSIVNAPLTLEEAMDPKVTYDNLRSTTKQLFRLIQAVRN
ncbi:glycerate kinase [Bacillus sp. AFS041924]|uniref:glycerate kinase family protein n=1 Tax=Bacillus sp. AFS041924 TaxID=2033503 RepID=UPI000BFDF16E|nr:glycerate kinase [Bacillus sp. AFS041924]PGS54198.1 glycerate kinase [Bacillus sp. AFS041924]